MYLLDALRSHILALPDLAKFAVVVAVIVGVPAIARRLRLPEMVGLLVFGVLLGPHVLGFFGQNRPVAEFFAELGKLLLMFSAGLEIDVLLFRKVQNWSIIFGVTTTMLPLLLGTLYGLECGYAMIPAIVIGSLLASHTLLGLSIVSRFGGMRFEPMIVAVGATVISDTLSLIVFAVCISTYTAGFSFSGLAIQLLEIAIFVPFVLFGLSRLGAFLLSKVQSKEDAYFVLMLGIMAIAGVIAQAINLPDIVGAFLAGLAVNAAVHDKPARAKLEFFGQSLFIPSFFIVTGFLINPVEFVATIVRHFPMAVGIVITLLAGKWLAAETVGRAFGYRRAARQTVWALTLPQVAATLAATLVAYDTRNAAGQRLLDGTMLNVVLVLMLATSIIGPVLTEQFAASMVEDTAREKAVAA